MGNKDFKQVDKKWDEQGAVMAVMSAQDERVGAASPLALVARNPFLIRDIWLNYVRSNETLVAEEVWAWGGNHHGQLGLGDTNHRTTPTEITALHGKHIKSVACGMWHTMVVLENGELWAMGNNGYCQLGCGDSKTRTTPEQVMAFTGKNVIAVACGYHHTLALLDSGELFGWGFNEYYQLASNDLTPHELPTLITALSGKHVTAIACGFCHNATLLENGDVFTWGGNFVGQLGHGDIDGRTTPTQVMALTGNHVVSIACGDYHTAAVLDNGDLFMWGRNEDNQLGIGDCNDRHVPTQVTALSGRRVAAIACGNLHTLALLSTSEVFAWGRSRYGQLGLGNKADFSTPQQVHFFDGLYVKSIHSETGEVFTWGYNEGGRLGLGDTQERTKPKPVKTLAGKHVVGLPAGYNVHFALVIQ